MAILPESEATAAPCLGEDVVAVPPRAIRIRHRCLQFGRTRHEAGPVVKHLVFGLAIVVSS